MPSVDEISKKDAFTDIELKLIEKADDVVPFADVILILCYTGFRIQELLILDPNFSVDLSNMALTGGLKTDAGKGRIVPIHPKIQKHIRNWLSKKGETLICRENGKPFTVRDFRANYYKPTIESIENVRDLLPHCCRHTFATLLYRVGTDPIEVQRLLGHANYSTSVRYTHRPRTAKNAVGAI